MKRVTSILFSTRLTALLFLSFATAMAIGTFIESKHGTPAARILIYNAKWFEFIMVLFMINFMGNISRYRLFRKEKWAILLLHLSFIIIILGAFATRYIGYEGSMPIREGSSSNLFLSEKTYLTTLVDGEYQGETLRKSIEKPLLLSEYTNNNFEIIDNFKEKKIAIGYKKYYLHAKEGIVSDSNGKDYLKIVEAGSGTRHDHFIKSGEVENIHNILIGHNTNQKGIININTSSNIYTIYSPFDGTFMRMADKFSGKLHKNTIDTLQLRSLYSIGDLRFVFPDRVIKGKKGVVKTSENDSTAEEALIVDVTVGNTTKEVFLLGGKGRNSEYKDLSIEDLTFHLSFGSISYKLPFSITLKDFIADKYPGTEKSYSSFMSKVTVNDSSKFDYDIYMNHVLDHGGYRFFQASFSPDEKGTILSVNHDFLGTWISYIGYFLLYTGLMGFMFFGETRFIKLGKKLQDLRKQRPLTLLIFCLLTAYTSWSQHPRYNEMSQRQIDSVIKSDAPTKKQASNFGRVIVQDDDGRMKPINTFASELIRKVSKRERYVDLNSDQILLSMMKNSMVWYYAKFIYLKRGNDSIRKILGLQKKEKYARAIDFFDKNGKYKLSPYLRDAYATSTPNQFQKDFKEADLRLAILNRTLNQQLLKIFPLPNDSNHKWINTGDLDKYKSVIKDTLYRNFVSKAIHYYIFSLKEKDKKSVNQAQSILDAIKKNQRKFSGKIMPSEKRIEAEIIYNKYDIFKKLFSYYMYFGSLLMIILIVRIFKNYRVLCIISKVFEYVIFILFGLHTLGLISRWYISGHAPWSDAYESMIYISWATMGVGMLFAKKSSLTLAATTFVSSMILMVAHWNWLDPSIANLQPVLNSYWLMIHVAIIVASYGPFTLAMMLGVVNLILILLINKSNKNKVEQSIKELTIVCELSLTVGLIMLTIGNFLGGQWANESWGRYWGWDPKETWALISIMVYAFVIHMRFVPKLRGLFAFNLAAIVAYSSILMTYFGVNFYLSGMHSYASGDSAITPSFVYYSVLFVAILAILSYLKYRKVKNKSKDAPLQDSIKTDK